MKRQDIFYEESFNLNDFFYKKMSETIIECVKTLFLVHYYERKRQIKAEKDYEKWLKENVKRRNCYESNFN